MTKIVTLQTNVIQIMTIILFVCIYNTYWLKSRLLLGNQSALLTSEGHFANQLGYSFVLPQFPPLQIKKLFLLYILFFLLWYFFSPCFFVDNFVLLQFTVYYNLHHMVFSIKWRTTQGTNSLSWVEHAKDFWNFLQFFIFFFLRTFSYNFIKRNPNIPAHT